ncbi:sugar ABC transporter ATP-binding protein [Amycolatopsis keratiniphila]|uniref:sugar ABC transporter ATP-binding protein n=1 Tax=Amycolatopsis keratiniphila TaxID=129921 RepID=UPI00087CBF93|nr:sugar ABC transporter ATP-binding protein [Amycolatopsis keratiniphila]OLZ58873.1 multidrug ABC transporter ATP-binding protein [Amycolatopsis keratiniphila subsp. nogabecina]SDU70238.1 monosaccharide ABC transporter ATP-binding protein, CUT2 family [Amycolatopsis keratiniphila]
MSALPAGSAAVPVVSAQGVGKRYGPTVALSDVSLTVHPGESHALVGRNGAGKSTLVSILTGLSKTDTGHVEFGGVPAPPLSKQDDWKRAVACVYQHAMVVPQLTVAENLFLNRQSGKDFAIGWQRLRRQARDLLDSWDVRVDVDTPAGELSVEDRQFVEIARALSYGARFIVLDEPTAQLDSQAIDRLFARMRQMQANGVTFLFISHHLHEVYEVCQAVTVLRDAKHILTAPVSEVGRAELIDAMTGEQGGLSVRDASTREALAEDVAEVLAVDGLSGDGFEDVTFRIHRGEVIGLAGSNASGKHQVAETVYGLRSPTSGTVRVDGKPLNPGDIPAAIRAGIGCVPRDRHHEGLVLEHSIADNATLSILDRMGKGGLAAPGARYGRAVRALRDYDIVAADADQPVSDLSGGNQQKVVLARALAGDPRLVVLINPTAGVDVKSKEALLAVVDRVRAEGKAVLIVSDELDDLRLSDRVLVLRAGAVVAEHPAGWSDGDLVADIEGVER